jgi:hypothetical protein
VKNRSVNGKEEVIFNKAAALASAEIFAAEKSRQQVPTSFQTQKKMKMD